MSLFGIFKSNPTSEKSKKEIKQLPWIKLISIEQLDEIIALSRTTPVVVFKHSTRCGISRMVIRQFEGSYDIDPQKMKLYYLDLLSYREISDEVAARFQQLIVIKNGEIVYNASHHNIHAAVLQKFV